MVQNLNKYLNRNNMHNKRKKRKETYKKYKKQKLIVNTTKETTSPRLANNISHKPRILSCFV